MTKKTYKTVDDVPVDHLKKIYISKTIMITTDRDATVSLDTLVQLMMNHKEVYLDINYDDSYYDNYGTEIYGIRATYQELETDEEFAARVKQYKKQEFHKQEELKKKSALQKEEKAKKEAFERAELNKLLRKYGLPEDL